MKVAACNYLGLHLSVSQNVIWLNRTFNVNGHNNFFSQPVGIASKNVKFIADRQPSFRGADPFF